MGEEREWTVSIVNEISGECDAFFNGNGWADESCGASMTSGGFILLLIVSWNRMGRWIKICGCYFVFVVVLGVASGPRRRGARGVRGGRDARHPAAPHALPQRGRRSRRTQRRCRHGERHQGQARTVPEEHRRTHGKNESNQSKLITLTKRLTLLLFSPGHNVEDEWRWEVHRREDNAWRDDSSAGHASCWWRNSRNQRNTCHESIGQQFTKNTRKYRTNFNSFFNNVFLPNL